MVADSANSIGVRLILHNLQICGPLLAQQPPTSSESIPEYICPHHLLIRGCSECYMQIT